MGIISFVIISLSIALLYDGAMVPQHVSIKHPVARFSRSFLKPELTALLRRSRQPQNSSRWYAEPCQLYPWKVNLKYFGVSNPKNSTVTINYCKGVCDALEILNLDATNNAIVRSLHKVTTDRKRWHIKEGCCVPIGYKDAELNINDFDADKPIKLPLLRNVVAVKCGCR